MHRTRLAFARIHSLAGSPVLQLLLLAALGLGVGATGHYAHQPFAGSGIATYQPTATSVVAAAMPQALQNTGQEMAAALAPTPVSVSREVELDEGQSFAELLTDQGIATAEATAAMNALAKGYDLRRLRAGQDVTLSFLRTGKSETFESAVFQPEDTKEITILRADQRLHGRGARDARHPSPPGRAR